jgi:exonuclease SbcC
MRPHLLEFTALGSYPNSVSVDFDALAPQGLFHIHGPTGAGKSSLIDAMCFALYGTIPSPRRADGLRSHHADPKLEAVVRFEFSAQGERWKIIRTPAQLRAKLRGDGFTEQRPTASLQRKEGGGWATVSSGVKEVDPIVHRILGLDADQFMQVVVLPQGGFQRVLRAGADEREDLLRHLFGSERFRVYTERLKVRADHLKQRVESQRHAQDATAARIAAGLQQFDIVVDDFPQIVDDDTLYDVNEALVQTQDVANKRQAEVEAAATAVTDADVRLRRSHTLFERWRRKVGATATLNALEEQREEVEAIRGELAHAERAAPLAPLFHAAQEAHKLFLSASSTREVAQSSIRTMLMGKLLHEEVVSAELSKLLVGVPAAGLLDEVRRNIRLRSTEVSVAADQARQALHARADVRDFRGQIPPLTETQNAIKADIASLDGALTHDHETLTRLQSEAAREPQITEELRLLQNRIAAAKALGNEKQRTQEIRTQLDAVVAEKEQAEQQHFSLLERRIKSMAGELASQLIDGDPCTVCGSTAHPNPAVWSDIVSDVDISAAANNTERIGATIADIRRRLDEAQQRETAYATAAGDVLENRATALSTLEQLQQSELAAQRSEAQARDLERSMNQSRARIEQLQARLAQTSEKLATTTSRLHDAQARLAELEARIGDQAGQDVIELASSLESAHEAVDALANSIEEERMRAEAWESAQSRLDQHARDSEVDDVADALAYLRNETQLRELRERVKRWDLARASAESTLAEPTVRSMTEEPDVQTVETVLQEAQARHEAALKAAATADAQVKHLVDAVEELRAEYERFKPLLHEHETVHQLYELCNGGRSNTKRQSLERYILASYLEEVAEAASKRLHLMSAGRYSLRHSDARVRGNAASGLALLVTDAYTGQEREVSTLSGGETFLASLALALGLADVVQAKAGGVHIEALFIDEGFGSLDPEALELAMAELDRLREGGRLVGVISHVATLRERIPAGIEVIRGAAGSTIRQHNGIIDLRDKTPASASV